MKRFALLPVVVVLVAAACTDKSAKRQTPTGPRAVAAKATGFSKATTVCRSYARERLRAQAQLATKPRDVALQGKVASLNIMIADRKSVV